MSSVDTEDLDVQKVDIPYFVQECPHLEQIKSLASAESIILMCGQPELGLLRVEAFLYAASYITIFDQVQPFDAPFISFEPFCSTRVMNTKNLPVGFKANSIWPRTIIIVTECSSFYEPTSHIQYKWLSIRTEIKAAAGYTQYGASRQSQK